jgi:hypothetical protein
MMCSYSYRQVLLTQLIECAGFDLEDAEASVDPLGLRTESGSVLWVNLFIMMLI